MALTEGGVVMASELDSADKTLIYCLSLVAAVAIFGIACLAYLSLQPQTIIQCPKCHERFVYTLNAEKP